MPPQTAALLQALTRLPISRRHAYAASIVSLFAAVSIQARNANILADLRDNPGAYQKRIRRGRGPSSGYGKTSGRGHNGQKQHGKVHPWFQGGQTPLIVSHGRKGFENLRAPVMAELNVDRLQTWIDSGRIDPTKRITPYELYHSGLVTDLKDGVKLLARGKETLRTPIDILISRASAAAVLAVEAAGGRIMTRYYTKQSMARLIKGESINSDTPLPVGPEHVQPVLEAMRKQNQEKHLYRLPDPTSRWDMEYYRDPAHRGYLSHQLEPGESPSLFFKVPDEEIVIMQKKKKKGKKERSPEQRELF